MSGDLWEVWLSSELVIGDSRVVPGAEAATDPGEGPGGVHLVTGWNPAGVAADPEANADANRRLAAELALLGVRHEPATGRAPDGSWEEPGFALHGASRAEACAIGRRYGQLAIYEWRPATGTLLVLTCDGRRVEGRRATTSAR